MGNPVGVRSACNNDESVLPRLAQREPGAAEAFVQRFRPLLSVLAGRYCPPSDTEDAVQDILFEVWKTAGRFDPELGSETTFVATLARRRLIDRLRRQGTRPPMDELDDADASSTDDPAETRLMMSSVSTALRQLRPDHRKVLEMSLVEGYTHVEIAEALELPLGTVKTIARRGVRRVRDDLLPNEPRSEAFTV